MYADEVIDRGMGCMAILFALGIAIAVSFGAGALLDTALFERRAFPSIASCQAKRMNYTRKLFSTDVVCLPPTTRQDTTTVQVR